MLDGVLDGDQLIAERLIAFLERGLIKSENEKLEEQVQAINNRIPPK